MGLICKSTNRCNRGNNGVANSNNNTSSNTSTTYGWRPVLNREQIVEIKVSTTRFEQFKRDQFRHS